MGAYDKQKVRISSTTATNADTCEQRPCICRSNWMGANIALDRKSDWQYVHCDSIARAKESQVNYRLSFDGAKRGGGDSAAGVVLIAYYSNGDRELLYRAGRLLGDLDSSFTAEALALEWSLDMFLSMVVAS